MIISKFSRGLVVCIFSALMLCLMYLDLQSVITSSTQFGSLFLKILYIISIFAIIFAYSVIKERLSKKNVNKKRNAFIRYTFIVLFSFVIKLLIGIFTDPKQAILNAFVFAVLSLVNAVVLKKIIYNISKSDVLSALGMVMYVFLPNISFNRNVSLKAYILTFTILMIIMFMQKIIDELKQIGIKNKKYIVLSLICGLFVTLSMLLGVNVLVWIVALFVTLISTSNLDKTHINFSNKFINMLRQKSKELLYRFERIYINKVLIVLFVMFIEVFLLYTFANFLIYNVINNEGIINFVNNIKVVTNNVSISFDLVRNSDFTVIFANLKMLVSNTKIYTFILTIYIIFIEILNVVLRRKYDTKSTIIKAIFVLTILAFAIFNLDYVCYTELFQTFLILIAIINTTNLYLNRDERIKLLNS